MSRRNCNRRSIVLLASALPVLVFAIGCEDEPAKPRVKTRETIGKTTQEVYELKAELAKGAILAETTIPESDPLTQDAAAYRTSVAKIAKMRVQHDIQIYEALNGEKPKTYDDFMEQIIKKGRADGIQLPVLPYYQEYAYDADNQQLVVIEYPDKKKARQEQNDRDMGRK